MLQKDRLEALSDDGVLLLKAEKGENIAILGDNLVRLDRVAEELAVVNYRQLCLWMLIRHHEDSEQENGGDR